jgi:hypothetical protein
MSWEDILKEQGPLSNFIADLLYDFPDAELSVVEQTRGYMGRELRQKDSPDSKKESDSMQILRIVRDIPLELQNKLVAPIVNIFRYRRIEGVGDYFGDAPNIQTPNQRQRLPTSVNVNSGPPNFGSIYTKAEIKGDDVFEFQLTTNNPRGFTSDEGDITTIFITVKKLAREGGRIIGKQTERRKKFREIAHMRLKRFIRNNQVRISDRR